MVTPSREESVFYSRIQDIEKLLRMTTNPAEAVVRILQITLLPTARELDSGERTPAYQDHVSRIISDYARQNGIKVPEYRDPVYF